MYFLNVENKIYYNILMELTKHSSTGILHIFPLSSKTGKHQI